jgi:glycine cleavage system aminomethyltransferase T
LQEKGTLSGSNFIYEFGCNEDGGNRLVIGFVMSGMFSPSRGREHGVGLLSAPALVHYLSKGDHGILAVQRKSSNHIRYFIRVVVMSTEHDVNRKKALISLLL